jgi:tetratricopeptide (TPR) repeat protein
MATAATSIGAAACLVLFAAGLGATAYARWTRPIADGDAALANGQTARALAAYGEAEAQFDRLPALRQVAAADYHHAVANQLWLLYRLERYDDLIAKSERAPEDAAPHFWAGLAFFAKAKREVTPGAQLGWLTRSEEELRRAVEAAPDDWDTKYDFELVSRLAAERRKQPTLPPRQLLQLLRPQPEVGNKPARRVG